jgi:hypothetical protein
MVKQRRPEYVLILQCMISLFIISLAILNALPLTIFSATTIKPTHTVVKNIHLSSSVHRQANPPWKETSKVEVQNAAQEYMQALLDQQQSIMWSLLHPQIQAKWPNENAFATFIQNHFKGYTLQGFTIGNVQGLSFWIDPETMISYTQLEEIPDYIRTWVVPPASFSQQLDYLAMHHYHTITFNQLFDALYYGGPLPSKPIILTFDDGDDDHYQYVYPILLAHHFSGMFYIITGQVGWYGRMTWSQIREMLSHGMQIGSHTVHHVDLSRLLYISEEAVQQELQHSQLTLEKELGSNIQQFCYPYGDPFNRGNWLHSRRSCLCSQVMAM